MKKILKSETELSPAALAVRDAAEKETDLDFHSAPAIAAAALEAVADRGECVEIVTAPGFHEIDAVLRVSDILAIAAELRGTTTTPENN